MGADVESSGRMRQERNGDGRLLMIEVKAADMIFPTHRQQSTGSVHPFDQARTPSGSLKRQTILVVAGDVVRSRLLSACEAAQLMVLPDS